MPGPAERKSRKIERKIKTIPVVGKTLKQRQQLNRLALKAIAKNPHFYTERRLPLPRLGSVAEWERRDVAMTAQKKKMFNLAKKNVVARAKRINSKQARKK